MPMQHPVATGLTVRSFYPIVQSFYRGRGAAKVYCTYWDRFVESFGEMEIAALRPSDVMLQAQHAQTSAIRRRFHSNGISAQEHYISAARAFLHVALIDGMIERNVAQLVPMPTRSDSRRFALTSMQTQQLLMVAGATGRDRELDQLLIMFHYVTGARREGALNLQVGDLLQDRLLGAELDEKMARRRRVPITPILATKIEWLVRRRGDWDNVDSPVFLQRNGSAITRRRYNSLFDRLQREIPWAAEIGVTTHWLRHCAITEIDDVAGYAVAAAFAGHRPAGETATYVRSDYATVCAAQSKRLGFIHPMASGPDQRGVKDRVARQMMVEWGVPALQQLSEEAEAAMVLARRNASVHIPSA
jgi:integrase/recombinase XerC